MKRDDILYTAFSYLRFNLRRVQI